MIHIEHRLLSPEEAAATCDYLKSAADQAANIGVRVQSLFGRCCLESAGLTNSLAEMSKEAAHLADGILADRNPGQLDLDPLLLIGSYQMLSHAGVIVKPMYRVLEQIATALQLQPAATRGAGRVRHMSSQLAELGFAIRPGNPSSEMARLLGSPAAWFGASVPDLAELAHHLIANRRSLDEMSGRALSLLALAELRNYRIDLGCTLLQAVLQLGELCAESSEALNFIALQRRRDGRYGFPSQFAGATEQGSVPDSALYLPLTVNAVWLFSTAANCRSQFQPTAIG